MQPIKCFVISLSQSKERRQACCQNLEQLGLEYEVFPATDGLQMTEDELKVCDLSANVFLNLAGKRKMHMDNALSLSEAGCALSHLRVYQHILNQNLDYAFILEDDCLVKPAFKTALQAVPLLKKSWELISFANASSIRSFPWAKKIVFANDPEQYFKRVGLCHPYLDALYNSRRLIYGTFLYVISAAGCKKLLHLGYPVRLPSDILTGYLAFNRLKAWQVFPAAPYYADFDKFETLIPDRPKHDLHHF